MFASLLKQLRAKKVGDWERGRSKPGYDALIALSRFFEVSAGRLLEIPEVSDLVCDGVPLSEAEADLIAMYRILDDHGREDVFDFVTMKYEKATGEKGSIYSTYIEDENARKKSGPLLGLDAQDGTA